jgi:hypothetical protein
MSKMASHIPVTWARGTRMAGDLLDVFPILHGIFG